MEFLLTTEQAGIYKQCRQFVEEQIMPGAGAWEKDQLIPREVLRDCGLAGYTGCLLPKEYGGGGMDMVSFGLINEAFGYASSSVTSLFTVQSMVSMSLLKWGTKEQCLKWLPGICAGDTIASFALTEPGGGSNIQLLQTRFNSSADHVVLNGQKKWITFGAAADIFLVFGKLDGKQNVAFVIEKNTPGLTISPITDMMGFRASQLALLQFDNCIIPYKNMIGKPGFGISCVANIGLHIGRISTAWSATGLIRACLDESIAYATQRKIGSQPICELPGIRDLIADIGCRLEYGHLLNYQSAFMEDQHSPAAFEKAVLAKLLSAQAAVLSADSALQIWGAAGCHDHSRVASLYRNARIMEVIEGTSQVCKSMIGESLLKNYSAHKSIAPVYEQPSPALF